jgi:hypothetical protein
VGALIAFEQDANLDEFVVGQGTVIDASVQRELLVSLFLPESMNKLHDGAVVIRNLRVAKAGVFFPMPDTKVLDKSLGSRHRAALGITEETDAVVVVVSEERGSISFCFNGNIVSNLDGASLRQALLGLFGQRARTKRGKGKRASGTTTGTGSYRISLTPVSGTNVPAGAPEIRVSPGQLPTPKDGTPSTLPRRGQDQEATSSAGPPLPRRGQDQDGTSAALPPLPRRAQDQGEASDKEQNEPPSTRPMAPAKPIETPAKPSEAVVPRTTKD